MKLSKTFTPLMLFVLLFSSSLFAQSGWQELNPTPSQNGYIDIKMLNDNTGIAFGRDSIISRTTDGGETWRRTNTGIVLPEGYQVILEHISFINSQTGYIGGNYMIRTTDAGETWTRISGIEPVLFLGNLKFTSFNRAYSYTYGFHRTNNAGLSWTQLPVPLQNFGQADFKGSIDFINDNTGFIAGSNGIIVKTINGGDNWVRVLDTNSNNKFTEIKFLNSNTGIAITEKGTIFKSTTSGDSWSIYSSMNIGNIYGADYKIFSENFIIATLSFPDSVRTLKTHNGGINWVEFSTPADYFGTFDLTPNGTLFLCLGAGLIYKSVDNASTWECKTSKIGFIGNINSVKFLNENTGFFGIDKGLILKTSNSGISFSKINLNTTNEILAIEAVNDNIIYCAARTAIYKSINAGSNWSLVSSQDTMSFSSLKFFDEQNGVATAYTGFGTSGIYRTSDGGVSWVLKRAGGYFRPLNFINNTTGFAAFMYTVSGPHFGSSDYTKYFKTTDQGNTWALISNHLGNTTSIGFLNELTGFSVSYEASLGKTTDGGETWEYSGFSSNRIKKIQFINSLTGFAGKLKTTNGGDTWFGQDFKGTTFDFINGNLGFGGGYDGFIWKTTDGGGFVGIGNNGSEITDGYSLSQNYPNPFNPLTNIKFSIPKNGFVKISVYDMLGREIKELVNEFKQTGTYSISFDGANFSSGIYFYKLSVDNFVETKKMILVK